MLTRYRLQDIFDFFVRQLQHLSNTTSPHYPHYYYLLENLATVRSIVILGDLKNTQDIVSDIFKDFFDLAKAGLANNVQTCLTDIMVQLIEEYPQLPSDVIEVILAQFVKKKNVS
jgi:sister chromatid cohesion protein PDS5